MKGSGDNRNLQYILLPACVYPNGKHCMVTVQDPGGDEGDVGGAVEQLQETVRDGARSGERYHQIQGNGSRVKSSLSEFPNLAVCFFFRLIRPDIGKQFKF